MSDIHFLSFPKQCWRRFRILWRLILADVLEEPTVSILTYHEDGSSKLLHNIGKYLPFDIISHPTWLGIFNVFRKKSVRTVSFFLFYLTVIFVCCLLHSLYSYDLLPVVKLPLSDFLHLPIVPVDARHSLFITRKQRGLSVGLSYLIWFYGCILCYVVVIIIGICIYFKEYIL
jgi:hypothetical protein